MYATNTSPAGRPRGILKNTSTRPGESDPTVPPVMYSSSSSSTSYNVYGEDGSLADPRLLKYSRHPASTSAIPGYMSGPSPGFSSLPPANLQSSPLANAYSAVGVSGAQKPMSQWEMYNAPNPLTHRSGTRDKHLAKLVLAKSKKKAMMLKPLNIDDTPLLESRQEEVQNEGRYAAVPPLETYLYDEKDERLANFYKTAEAGDLMIVEYKDKNQYGLVVKLLCFDGGKRGVLDDLSIEGLIPYQQLDPKIRIDDDPRDFLRCELLEIGVQKMLLGTKGIVMPTELRTEYLLGLIDQSEFPMQYRTLVTERRAVRQRKFDQMLEQSPGFRNPHCVPSIACTQGLYNNQHTLMKGLSNPFSVSQLAKTLKEVQNSKSANQFVSEGVRYFKLNKGVEAFQCLNKALVTDPGNVDGLVARGALYANNGNFAKSKADLEAALKINPVHVNGRKYLTEVLFTLSGEHLKSNNLDEATDCFEQLISITTESKESSLILLKIHDIVDSLLKQGTSKMSTPMVDKILRFRDKLKDKIALEVQRSSSKTDYPEDNSRVGSVTVRSKADESDTDSHVTKDKKKKKSKKKKKKEHRSKREAVSPISRKRSIEVERNSDRSSFKDQEVDSYRAHHKELGIKKHSKSKEMRKRRYESSESSASDNPDVIDVEFYELETELAAKFVKNEHEKNAEDLNAYAPRKEDLFVRVPNAGGEAAPRTSLATITRTISNDALKPTLLSNSTSTMGENGRSSRNVERKDVSKPVPVKSKWKTFGEQSEEEGSPVFPPGDDSFVSARGATRNLVPPPPPRFGTATVTSEPERKLPFASALRPQPVGEAPQHLKMPRSNGRSRSRSRSSSRSRGYRKRRSRSRSRNRKRSYSRSKSRSPSPSKSSRRSRSDSRSRSRSPYENRFGGRKFSDSRIGGNRFTRSPVRDSSRPAEKTQRFYQGKHPGYVAYDKARPPMKFQSNGSRDAEKATSNDYITIIE